MFKKMKGSPYFKAACLMLISGGILIVFNNWITKTHFSVGFETINETLRPVYIGVICAFLVCPIYNWCVRNMYARMLQNATTKSVTVGTKRHEGDVDPSRVDNNDRRYFLTMSRVIATILCLLIVCGFIALLIYVIVPQVINSCISLADTMPERLAALSDWLSTNISRVPQLAKWVDNLANLGITETIKWIQEHIVGNNATTIATMISNGVVTAVNTVINTFVGILIMVYLLNYKETLFAMTRKFIAATTSRKTQDALFEFADIFNQTFIGFIVGRIIDSMIIGVLTYVVLVIFKMPFAPMIALIVGVTNVIPFFGPFIGAIPSFLIIMLESPVQALWFLLIILIIQQLDGNVIGPKIVGSAIGIGSFWVLIAVLIGGGLFGFTGMVFGVPVFAVLYRYMEKLTVRRLNKKGLDTHTSDYFSLDSFGIDAEEVDLEVHDTREKSLIDKFRKQRSVEMEMIEEMREEEERKEAEAEARDKADAENLEKLKEELAAELLMSHSAGAKSEAPTTKAKATKKTEKTTKKDTK